MGVVAAAVREGIRQQIISANPMLIVKSIRKKERLTEYHTLEEVKILFRTPMKPKDEILKRAYLFSCLTGMRVSDLFALRWEKVQAENLPTSALNYQISFIQKKVTDALYLPISAEAYSLLGISPEDKTQRVFPLTYSKYLTDKLRKWVQAAGIKKDIGWHTARHTHAILLLTGGADIYTVSKRLGHSSIAITEQYLHIVDKKMSEAANIIRLSDK
jgi:integrase